VSSAIHQFTNSGCFTLNFFVFKVFILNYAQHNIKIYPKISGAMFASTGSHCNCVDFRVSAEINRIVLFSCTSILLVCTLVNHTGAQYSASNRIEKCQ
jgi:hypothetical protein